METLLHKTAAGLGKPTVREAKTETYLPCFAFEHNELSLSAGDLYINEKISVGHIVYLNLIPDRLPSQTLLMVIACNQITN